MLDSDRERDRHAFEEALLQEVQAKPRDVHLRVQLVDFYQKIGKFCKAWHVCCEVEENRPWPFSMEWYSCIVEVCQMYQLKNRSECSLQFYDIYLASLDRLVDIMARKGDSANVLCDIIHKMDQTICMSLPVLPEKTLSHYKGQLFIGCATLLLKMTGSDMCYLAGLLYLMAFNEDVVSEYSCVGGARKVIAGHMVQLLFVEDIRRIEMVGSEDIGEKLYTAVFGLQNLDKMIKNSCLAQTTLVSIRSLPTAAEIDSFCPSYVSHYISDLHMLVCFLARYHIPGSEMKLQFNLNFDVKASSCEKISSRELTSFLSAVVYSVLSAGSGDELRGAGQRLDL